MPMPIELVDIETILLAGGVVTLVAGTVAHEFGHAVAAWSVGMEPRLISVGYGAAWARLRVRGAWLVLRRMPIGGYMHALIGPDTTARQRFVMAAGGPAATLLLGVAVLIAAALTPIGDARAFLEGAVAGQLLILAGSAVPYGRKLQTHVSISDGMRLLQIARGEHRGAFDRLQAGLLRRHLPEGATPPPPSRHFPEIVFQRTRRDRRTDGWAQDEAAESLHAVLAADDLPDGERAMATELLELNEAHRRVRTAKAELAALRRGGARG